MVAASSGRSNAEILRACYGVEFPVEVLVIAEMKLDDAEPQVDYLQRPWELLTPLSEEALQEGTRCQYPRAPREPRPRPKLREGRLDDLVAVCLCGDLVTARLLLDRGADPNRGESGTPRSVAKEKGYEVLVDLLLERGAVR